MTQAELTELLLILQELEGLGWPVKTNEFKRSITVILGDDRDPAPTYEIFLNLYAGTAWTIAATLIPGESAEDLITGYLEREVERRGLWREYLTAMVAERDALTCNEEEGYSWYILSKARPTVLEVARAALAVAKEEFGAVGPGEVAP